MKLAERIGVAAAARELSLYESQLYNWRSRQQQQMTSSERENELAAENTRLKRQKATITQLRSKAIVNGILAAIYTGPTKDDSTTAAADFVNHPPLYNDGSVRTACGNNFNKIQSAFVGQARGIVEILADAVIDADKTGVEALVEN